jgi:transcriptional/translational regulatory protein YebC/TACO1
VFTRNGGSMAEPGAVGWQFARKGVIALPRSADEDKIMEIAVEAGAEDLTDDGDSWVVTSAPQDLAAVRAALDTAGIVVDSAELAMVPSTTVPVTQESEVRRVLRLLEALDDDDDVQNVWSNFETPDEVLAAAAAD